MEASEAAGLYQPLVSSDGRQPKFRSMMGWCTTPCRTSLKVSRTGKKNTVTPLVQSPEEHDQKQVSLHLRVINMAEKSHSRTLYAIIWLEDGSFKGPFRITLRSSTSLETHAMCETNLHYPLSAAVAFLQLKAKRTSAVKAAFGLEEDIFLQDAYLKVGADPSPCSNILAYFAFAGFLVYKNHLLLTNLITHERRLDKNAVQSHVLNEGKRLQSKPVALPTWASADDAQTSSYKYRSIYSAIGFSNGKSIFAFLINYVLKRNKPLLANVMLGLDLDIPRFLGTPGFAPMPPVDHTFSNAKFMEFMGKRYEPIPFAESAVAGQANPWRMSHVDFSPFLEANETQHYKREVDEIKRIAQCYPQDDEFGRQITEGLFCTQIHVVPADESNRPAWLTDLIAQARPAPTSRLFFMDYSCLVGVPRNEEAESHFTPARCLLEHNGEVLRPIAISLFYCREYYSDLGLFQDSEANLPVESEAERLSRRLHDGVWRTHLPFHRSWSVAKLFCKCAAGQHHQIVAHALYTHLVVEPFAVALERLVPLDHILYRLLKTHFRYTLDVNFKARTALISKDGLLDDFISTGGIHAGYLQFMAKTFEQWTIDKMILPLELRSRGFVEDPRNSDRCELPEYRYAQDAMALWEAMEEYVRNVIHKAYPLESDFQSDTVVRNYFMEVQMNGFPNSPTFLPATRDSFATIVTGIIFTATVQHTAVNFQQFSHFAFIANSPVTLSRRAPQPDAPTVVNGFLPSEEQAKCIIASSWGLSRLVPEDERFLLAQEHPCSASRAFHEPFSNLSLYNDPYFRDSCEGFVQKLRKLESHIEQREPSKYGTRYMWLQPSLIPTSIAT